MKHLIFTKFLSVVCVLFSGYTFADVAHPEDPNIVGGVFGHEVCFNSDGAVDGISECDGSDVDEGRLGAYLFWWRGMGASGINGCGLDAVNPVSSATCPFYDLDFGFTNASFDKYVLVQTTGSVGHYWAVLADDTGTIATPETTSLVPCLTTDAFDPDYGCYAPSPPEISIEDGFIKLDTSTAPPNDVHCLETAHEGRMVVDSVHGKLYICTEVGWESITTDKIP